MMKAKRTSAGLEKRTSEVSYALPGPKNELSEVSVRTVKIPGLLFQIFFPQPSYSCFPAKLVQTCTSHPWAVTVTTQVFLLYTLKPC